MSSLPHPFQKRIEYQEPLAELLIEVANEFQLDEYQSHAVIEHGYEDFNVNLTTTSGNYIVKVLAKYRTPADCQRFTDIMTAVDKADLAHPKIFSSNQGLLHSFLINDQKASVLVMEFIDGQSFYESKEQPSESEVKFLVNQAIIINQLPIKPPYLYDTWAVVNFDHEYRKIRPNLSAADQALIDPTLEEFTKLDLNSLPHCFVHGDLIDTNVLKNNSGQLYIIDFSCSNYYPRIQELAILLCDILFDSNHPENFDKTYQLALETYQQQIKLTSQELEALPLYVKAAHAMHIVGASATILDEEDSTENQYWLKMGRDGLMFSNQFWK
jgi:Ser/Thr protein kinase RdoA (MazF antagonist)